MPVGIYTLIIDAYRHDKNDDENRVIKKTLPHLSKPLSALFETAPALIEALPALFEAAPANVEVLSVPIEKTTSQSGA